MTDNMTGSGAQGLHYGLIGWPLGHSFSERIHRLLGNEAYRLFPLKEQELDSFLRRKDTGGLNVTIPYKKKVVPYCTELSAEAREIGCVNVLQYTERGIIGHNTDAAGMMFLAAHAGISMAGKKVVILGTGGTSLTAAWCAEQAGASRIVRISRSGPDNYDGLARHRDADVLINTTPVGMYPDNGTCPVRLETFERLSGVLDAVYNPLRTQLVLRARELGIPACGGLPMLAAQAEAADRIFFGGDSTRAAERTEAVLKTLLRDMENVVLIGMPGCGKSSIGRMLAEKLGRPFVDLDEEVVKASGRTPAEIIRAEGEKAFRDLETEQTLRAAKETGLVISCGGGTVLRPENVRALKQNGRLIWIRRALEQLPKKDRPLSADLPTLYRQRLPVYRAAADAAVENDGTLQEAADRAARLFTEGAKEV